MRNVVVDVVDMASRVGNQEAHVKGLVLALTVLLGLFEIGPAFGHQQGTTYLDLAVSDSQIDTVLRFHVSDLIEHFHLDIDADGKLSPNEIRAGEPAVRAYIVEHVRLAGDMGEVLLTHSLTGADKGPTDSLVSLRFSSPLRAPLGHLQVEAEVSDLFGDEHVILAKVASGPIVQQAVLVQDEPRYTFQLGGRPAGEARSFIWLGVEHIFLGYDHILFLIALIVAGSDFKDLLKIVTAFTVAHSLTLALAALELVVLPTRLVEAVIAASIVYVAVENFLRQEKGSRWRLTFFFGLVHGFGFANVLRDLELPTDGLVLSLVSFNVGVELGQVAILVLLFPFSLWLSRQEFQYRGIQVVSSLVLLLGLGWFIERAFSLEFMPI